MSVRLALANLRHNLVRTALSLAGVGFAVVLIFMELGFLGAVQDTAVLIYDKLEFDLLLRSPDYLHLADARTIPRHRLHEAASVPGVQEARPFHVTLGNWQTPAPPGQRPAAEASAAKLPPEGDESATVGQWLAILVLGVAPEQNVIDLPGVQRQLERLTTDSGVLMDRKSQRSFGPADGRRFGDQDLGVCTDLSGRQVCIQGVFELGTGLAANGAVLTTERGFARVAPYDAVNNVSLGLVKVAPGDDPAAVKRRLTAWFGDPGKFPGGPPLQVLTREELLREEKAYWVWGTPVGLIFMMSVLVALLVGSAIIYMVLSNDVETNLGEYATLNAMGYSKSFLAKVVLWLSFLLAATAYLPSVLAAIGLYALTESVASVPIRMTVFRVAYVLLLTLLMSVVSGFLAMRKLQQADPADLF